MSPPEARAGLSAGALARTLALGLIAIALGVLVPALLVWIEWDGVRIFVSVVVSLACGAWCGMALVKAAGGPSTKVALGLGFVPLLLAVGAGIVGASSEHLLFGGSARGISVSDAGQHSWASVFKFNDGEAQPALQGDSEIYGSKRGIYGGSYHAGSAFVVPVTPAEWTHEQPIAVWAVARVSQSTNNLAENRKAWKEPARGGIRVVGLYVSNYIDAIHDAERVHNISSASDPLLIHWCADPDAEQASARLHVVRVTFVAYGLWLALLGAASVVRFKETANFG